MAGLQAGCEALPETHQHCSHHTNANGEGMTCSNTTPEIRTSSTPTVTDSFRYRYAKTELAVLSDRRLTANDRLVYATLKAHRNHKSGTAWPSRQVIGAIAGCSDRAVSLATSRLVQAGYLTKQQRTGQSTLYGFPLSGTPERAFTPTPERAFTHNKIIEEQNKEKPQLQRQPAERAVPAGVGVVVVRSDEKKSNLVSPVEPIASKAGIQIEAEPAPVSPVEPLTFPVFVTLAIQAQMVRMLCGLPFADSQRLLDELNGAGQTRAIKNPAGYLRTLLRLFLAGELIWEHADRIAAQRASQARNQAALQRALNMKPGGHPPDTPAPPGKRDQSVMRAELAKMRQSLGMREPGAG